MRRQRDAARRHRDLRGTGAARERRRLDCRAGGRGRGGRGVLGALRARVGEVARVAHGIEPAARRGGRLGRQSRSRATRRRARTPVKRVVLCRPSGPRNVGSIARVCANFGPIELVLAAPEKPSLLIHPEFEQMAHGVDLAAGRIRVVKDLREALEGCAWSYGFTARVRDDRVLLDWSEARGAIAERTSEEDLVALVFGNEITGLSGAEGSLCSELVRLPTSTEHTSLNLSMAVGVVLFSLFEGKALRTRPSRVAHIKQEAREYLIAHVKDVLGSAALSKSAREDIEESVERVFRRAVIETRDARAWHAVLRALGNWKVPQDYGLPPQVDKKARLKAREEPDAR
ncbi:MAG: hypothetical protein EPO68_06900 [Planctomycetota bacterium]|nr:MAG: hypothetical protein EPO68_06900 [Planctomycetota bacterium]